MKSALIVFPHQLYDGHPGLRRDTPVYLVEDQLFFDDYKYPVQFHKNKLILHRATLIRYHRKLLSQGYHIVYIEYEKSPGMSYLFRRLACDEIEEISYCDLADYELERRIRKECDKYDIKVRELDSPGFLNNSERIHHLFKDKEKFSFLKFYTEQRKYFNLLIEKNRPVGGKWSFDTLNRKKIPSSHKIPEIAGFSNNVYIEEAKEYIDIKFPDNPGGKLSYFYPVTCSDINKWTEEFFKKKFNYFGIYQDSVKSDNSFLYHSLFSYALNIGFLTPKKVIELAFDASKEYSIPINSLEGFIRQVAGWREYIRAIYLLKGTEERQANFWGVSGKMPASFEDGNTGIEPVDCLIHKVNETGYLNHIERLMFVGNFMLLCEIHPTEVYKWFMSRFIDAYDWVMVPNVYGMSQFADGGLISTKPYICSSNYILKMSDFRKGDWCEIWDSLYWRFIYKYKKYFAKNPRLSVMVSLLNKKKDSDLKKQLSIAEDYLSKLYE